MRIAIVTVMALFISACGDPGESMTAAAAEVDYCSCVNEPLNTDAKLKACGKLIDAMTPEESTKKAMECRAALPVPDDGPDLCFCLRTTTQDAAIMEACEALIPDDMTPRQLTDKIVECSR